MLNLHRLRCDLKVHQHIILFSVKQGHSSDLRHIIESIAVSDAQSTDETSEGVDGILSQVESELVYFVGVDDFDGF